MARLFSLSLLLLLSAAFTTACKKAQSESLLTQQPWGIAAAEVNPDVIRETLRNVRPADSTVTASTPDSASVEEGLASMLEQTESGFLSLELRFLPDSTFTVTNAGNVVESGKWSQASDSRILLKKEGNVQQAITFELATFTAANADSGRVSAILSQENQSDAWFAKLKLKALRLPS